METRLASPPFPWEGMQAAGAADPTSCNARGESHAWKTLWVGPGTPWPDLPREACDYCARCGVQRCTAWRRGSLLEQERCLLAVHHGKGPKVGEDGHWFPSMQR